MAETKLDKYAKEVQALVNDDTPILQPEVYKSCLQRAADDLSARRPRSVVEDLTSDGTGDFDTANFSTKFEEKYAGEIEIEYPISAAGEKRKCLKVEAWELVKLPDKIVLRLFSKPATGAQIRVTRGARHTLAGNVSTILDEDEWMLKRLAGAEACEQLARYYSGSTDNAIVDSSFAGFKTKDAAYKARAKELRDEALNSPTAWCFV